MISELTIDNFKIYGKLETITGFKNINLLTGINGRGKSTTMQPLLLLKQARIGNKSPQQVPLKGDLVKLGTWSDVKNNNRSVRDKITFGYVADGKNVVYTFVEKEKNNLVLNLEKEQIDNHSNNAITDETLSSLIYISADRIGPQLQYESNPELEGLDCAGKAVAQVLENMGDNTLSEVMIDSFDLLYPNGDIYEKTLTVMGMTEFWMSKMFGKTEVETVYNENMDSYTLKIKTRGGEYKPTNVGFGYTYALPIIVAGLTARNGAILIIENPESHLHPSAQAVITKFLCMVAQCGVQVFIETHSEHVLNAARVLVYQEALPTEDVNILYFGDFIDSHYKQIIIEENGKLSDWPRGFFDQAENDIKLLLGF